MALFEAMGLKLMIFFIILGFSNDSQQIAFL
ncbi:hypothetical protein BGP_6363 [Beggiatoa sp. PS]|nr:hypothetical protein BGP_6363 [Beggiatoa sp. PS]